MLRIGKLYKTKSGMTVRIGSEEPKIKDRKCFVGVVEKADHFVHNLNRHMVFEKDGKWCGTGGTLHDLVVDEK